MSKNSLFSTVFFIGLIYFIIQQIDNHLRQIVDFIFLPFFLTFSNLDISLLSYDIMPFDKLGLLWAYYSLFI